MAHILVGVGGGIAAYKAASLCSLLGKDGHEVQVLMTEHATKFITPLTFQSLTHKPVVVDTFSEPNPAEIAHIALADRADAYVIAPATANLIAKLALGIADDMVTTTALAVTAPLIVAPAMNVRMYEHPTVQENLSLLRKRGVIIADPGAGPLACGYTGTGRLAEPEDIRNVVRAMLQQQHDLTGLRLLVTAGPTVEDIDPVRYISNSSSGKMGYAIAQAAQLRGAEVTLVSGPTALADPPGVKTVRVRSTEAMLHAVEDEIGDTDVFISAAAPVDFGPTERLSEKWKKSMGIPQLQLESTPDVLRTVARSKKASQTFVGFAAETHNAVENSIEKLHKKNLDFVVVNNVLEPGSGFAVDTNQVTIVSRDESQDQLPLLSKSEVAMRILDAVVAHRAGHHTKGEMVE